MLSKISTFFLVILVAILASPLSWCASGRIEGKVTDATTGETLFGANIVLEGTSIGAATDINGNYLIPNVPVGSYNLKASYIGYKSVTVKVQVREGQSLVENIKMEAVSVTAKEVVVTAQASGQNAAINQQLSSQNIVNVVSSARIQKLPDANAAESIGRLPGISLLRSGGEATQVVIRGLDPQFSTITIDGVPIPANESAPSSNPGEGGGRGTDIRMVSSSMLNDIEVYKTNTPDMDAADIGGTVNLGIRKAQNLTTGIISNSAFVPGITLLAQGGYKDILNSYNPYKFDLTLEKRFFNNKFGVLIQGIAQQQNLTSNALNANYGIIDASSDPNKLRLNSLDLYFYPRIEKRYNGTVTFDYNLPNGNLALLNIFSKGETNTQSFQQHYGLKNGGNEIDYYGNNSPTNINLITNILSYNQTLHSFNVNLRLSHSYSENLQPDSYSIDFQQLSAGTGNVSDILPPVQIAEQAFQHVNPDTLLLSTVNTTYSLTRQRDLRGALDISRDFNIADFLSLNLKGGGMYSSTYRSYNYDNGSGYVWFGTIVQNIINRFPWLVSQYGMPASGGESVRPWIVPFWDPNYNIGNYLKGNYSFNNKLNMDYMSTIKDIVVNYGKSLTAAPTGGAGAWVPSIINSEANDYSGYEYRSAGYLMGTFNFGGLVTLIAGTRYQNLTTSYQANRFYNAGATNPYPRDLPHIDTTVVKTHGYWLPDVLLKINPLSWLSIRTAYTNTIAYPNYYSIVPIIDVYSGSVTWNNTDLKPMRSENYDAQLSVYQNYVGLFTFGGFLKHISDFVFYNSGYINNPADYPGLQYKNLNTKGFSINTYYNNPNRVDLYGVEADWQTHFWYLPEPLNGLVLNVNFTHILSKAKYPFTVVGNSGYPYYKPIYIDSTYQDRLIDQPDDIVNLSLGFDYKDFSILASMIYQSNIFNGTNFYNSLRTDKATYVRWDLVANQTLPWYNIQVYLNLNNLNGEPDTYTIRGNGYPQSESSYGLTADFGIRIKL